MRMVQTITRIDADVPYRSRTAGFERPTAPHAIVAWSRAVALEHNYIKPNQDQRILNL